VLIDLRYIMVSKCSPAEGFLCNVSKLFDKSNSLGSNAKNMAFCTAVF
jgi:hypothetical protein